MLKELNDIVNNRLMELLKDRDGWSTIVINRLTYPFTYRAFRLIENGYRLSLHRFEVCDESETEMHPHPWPGAFKILSGAYDMSIGCAPDRFSQPVHIGSLHLTAGASYEMANPLMWHSVTPRCETWTVMLNGMPYSNNVVHTAMREKSAKINRTMKIEELDEMLHKFTELLRYN